MTSSVPTKNEADATR